MRLVSGVSTSDAAQRKVAILFGARYCVKYQAYADWIRRFVLHLDKRHPGEPGAPEVEVF